MACTRQECIKIQQDDEMELRKIINEDDDEFENYMLWHCSVEGCHDLSPGKTSILCQNCHKIWVCQHHAGNGHMKCEEDDIEIDGVPEGSYGDGTCIPCATKIQSQVKMREKHNSRQ
jgi:hypothetical protein